MTGSAPGNAQAGAAPEIAGLGTGWINSRPLSLKSLRGKVVLLDFWEYTCVNCLRTLPYLKEWNKRYSSSGLVIIGVHTPEFAFAGKFENLQRAVKALGITYPVVSDSNYRIWTAYQNQYWPRHYLIDAHGVIQHDHAGEGAYQETEGWIQRLLKEAHPSAKFDKPMQPVRAEDKPGAVCYPCTPETYLGYERGEIGNPEGYQKDMVVQYAPPGQLMTDTFYAEGAWKNHAESLEKFGTSPSVLIIKYRASEVNIVLHPGPQTAEIAVTVDGKPLPKSMAGADVTLRGGSSVVDVKEPRMYRIISEKGYGTHVLRLQTTSPGMRAFAYTFGACEVPAR